MNELKISLNKSGLQCWELKNLLLEMRLEGEALHESWLWKSEGLQTNTKRLKQMITPAIHILHNLELMVQLYMPLSPFRDKANVAKEKELDTSIPLQDGMMQHVTPQTAHITPPDDVAPATNGNPVNDVKELSDIMKTNDFEIFIQKLLH
nr:hypothetical protein [Tanacetum cinerariifolium]